MTTATRPGRQLKPVDHGTPQCYRRGCNRPECTTAATADARKWKYLRDNGRSGFVPAEKVIARIWRLRAAGMTDGEIQDAARLSPSHIYQIIRNNTPVLHTTAARIFAVPVPENSGEPSRNGAYVPRLGTRRRLQALVADGWPANELDQRLGTGQGYTGYLMRGEGNDNVRLSTADAVRILYSQLAEETPEDHGIAPHLAKMARTRGTRKGWAGTAYWDADDFDNPDFTPATSDDLKRDELAAVRRHEVEHLDLLGFSPDNIAERLDMALSTVRAIVNEVRTGQRRDRTKAATDPDPIDIGNAKHGRSGYTKGCRCRPCKNGANDAKHERNARLKAAA